MFNEGNLLTRGQTVNNVPKEKTTPLVLEAGQMSLHHPTVVHGSDLNKSDDRRIGFVIQSYIGSNFKQVLGKNVVQSARGKDDYNFHETIGRPKSLMDKNDLKIKKKENDNLQEIFYKGSSKKGNYQLMKTSLNLAVLGIDHGHIFDMLDEMIKEGCNCNYFWTEGSPLTLKEFNKKYPNIKRVKNKSDILKDNSIDMVLISSIPKDRANLSIEVLNSGKDVMVDKPGCTTLNQLEGLKRAVKKTGKIWSVNFSERFHVAAVAKAEELVADGKIGKVKQTIGKIGRAHV